MLVKFTRPFEAGSVNGYVLGIGPRFFLLALIDDYIRFNGFECFRTSDVRHLEVPHKHVRFAEAALKKRGERMPMKPAEFEAFLKAETASNATLIKAAGIKPN